MSKPVKQLIRKQITGRLKGVSSVAVVDLTGVDANAANEIRSRLTEKDIRLSVVKNSLAKQAFKDVGLEAASGLLVGPCALAWGAGSIVSVVRELRDISKDIKALGLKGALLDGDVFDAGRMEELANFPTREEAIAQALQAVLSPGASLASCLIAPGGAIAALLETIEEQAGGDDAGDEDADDAGAPVPAEGGDSGSGAAAAEASADDAEDTPEE